MKRSATFIRFGPVVVELDAEPRLKEARNALERWLATGITDHPQTPDIVFSLKASPSESRHAERCSVSGPAWANEDVFGYWDGRAWEALVETGVPATSRPEIWRIHARDGLVLSAAKRVPNYLFRFIHHHYFNYAELQASTFLYRHLIPAVQSALIDKGASFIHSSALRHRAGFAVGVLGWGGAGKTSASSSLYLREPETWLFMGDDLSIVDERGTLYYSPLPLNIFPYNVRGFPQLESYLLSRMDAIERLHWVVRQKVFGPGRVVRRVGPPERVIYKDAAKAALFIHLERWTEREPNVSQSEPSALSDACKNILLYELRHRLPHSSLANSFLTGKAPAIVAFDIMARGTSQVLESAFQRASLWSVKVPERYTPLQIADLLKELVRRKGPFSQT